MAENILKTLQLPLILGGEELYTTSSVGIAFYEEDDSVKELLQKADAALYLAKSEGKNTYRITPSVTRRFPRNVLSMSSFQNIQNLYYEIDIFDLVY
ncbi:diguanylate cyclase [Paenibacillus illinoisensis]|uniref:diguanylate cyclase domain-containing protein n=1 Tax=Paenibacillus illinoisensis TaxID=59845 RepID=UPI003CE8FB83